MSLRHNALYFDLLLDLSEHLPIEVADEESAMSQEVWPDISLKQLQSLMLAKTFFKKFKDRSTQAADDLAVEKFFASNIKCREWEDLGNFEKGYAPRIESSIDETLVGEFRKALYDFYYISGTKSAISDLGDVVADGRVGPGASIGSRGTDFYTKLFSGPLSATKTSVYQAYTHYTSTNPNWSHAENIRRTEFGEVDIVVGNRLSCVPKNHDVSRCICTEPNLNMFFQLGIGAQLERRIKSHFGIDLSDQPMLNKILAQSASKTGKYATVDLSCASDSIAIGMLRENLPRSFMTWLDFARSPKVTHNGECEELHMVSSMGNGFTFPLQTAIFCCIIQAVYRTLEIRMRRNKFQKRSGMIVKEPGNWGVFGDDLIVETKAYDLLVRLLNLTGFSVNSEKSYHVGWFRESCGGDYFKGHPVRGVYIKSLRTQASRYVAINRLNRWSAMTGIPLRRTVRRILKSSRYLPVPLAENDDAGIKVPLSYLTDAAKAKLSKDQNTGAIRYKVWAARPSVIRLVDGEIRPPKGSKKRIYNAPGLLEAFLRGDIKEDTLTVRCGQPRYNPRTGTTPYWDYVPTVSSQDDTGQGRLATAIRINLPG